MTIVSKKERNSILSRFVLACNVDSNRKQLTETLTTNRDILSRKEDNILLLSKSIERFRNLAGNLNKYPFECGNEVDCDNTFQNN